MPELKHRLDAIGWEEQVELELAERAATLGPPDLERIDSRLCVLAESVDVALLDALEKEDGYLVWVLRLIPSVQFAETELRARRYVNDPNWRVRYWARRLLPDFNVSQ